MAEAFAALEVALPAAKVWQLIGGFGSLPDWLPYIPKSELTDGGRVRHLANPAGDPIVERMLSFSEASRSYSYAILKAPFPVSDYVSTLSVVEKGAMTCRVEWSGKFVPVGVTEQEASRLFAQIYEGGLDALKAQLAKHT
ncbi:SRPBCC family protein [Paraburkholderia sp. BR10936]|uniref:SRPBCC family protein n=1 Tax=Paraburkholderia sp. BR10936 TaxID=3236993 RepID=UPI0034D1F263